MNEIYLTVKPDLPCNGCNRPGKAGIVFKGGRFYTCDIMCRECTIHMNKMYNSEAQFTREHVEPVAIWDYPRSVETSVELNCWYCGDETNNSFTIRSDTQYPHNILMYPYCGKCEQTVKEAIG